MRTDTAIGITRTVHQPDQRLGNVVCFTTASGATKALQKLGMGHGAVFVGVKACHHQFLLLSVGPKSTQQRLKPQISKDMALHSCTAPTIKASCRTGAKFLRHLLRGAAPQPVLP